MARKNTKAVLVTKLLKKGYTVNEIKERMPVSDSYVWAIKKKLAEAAEKAAEVEAEAVEAVSEAVAKEPAKAATNEVDKVLDARADQYGSFMQSAEVAIKIKSIMHNSIARKDIHLYPDQLLALDMIAVKISRIVGGNAAHRDSWLDIAGYAKLVADRLGGISR